MTFKSPTECDLPPDQPTKFADRISFLCGQWAKHDQLRLSVDDLGFRQGVTIVERLRTYRQQIFAIDAHLNRWRQSAEEIGIDGLPSDVQLRSLLNEILDRNRRLLQAVGDVGITVFATPGPGHAGAPTLGLHLNQLDQSRIAVLRSHGQPLVVTDVKQQHPLSWPRTVKVRSRIHYYLADRMARRQNPEAVGVLLDDDGSVTETSIANLAIVESGQIVSPPMGRVLGGITQSVVQTLAWRAGIAWTRRPVSVASLRTADEVLLMGTGPGIWFANSVDAQPIGEGTAGPLYRKLAEAFDKYTIDQ